MEVERLRSFLQFLDSDNAVSDNKASPRYGNNPALTDAPLPFLTIVHLSTNTTTCELFQTVPQAGLPCLLQLITVGGPL